MVKGFKDKQKRFHPITQYKAVRKKKKSPLEVNGVKIVKRTGSKEMLQGITKSFQHQPKSVKDKIKKITLKNKNDGEDFVAKVDTNSGEFTFNKKANLTEGDYEALGDHEFEHIDFGNKIAKGNKKYENFVKIANTIEPFTPDLVQTKQEQDDAFIEGNFGILPDKRLEYPDEINSVVKEIETRKRLGLDPKILNEEEFQKAKALVDNIHRKKRDLEKEKD